MKYTFCEIDFLKLLADAGYTLEKYQGKGVFDAISGIYHANDRFETEYNGVSAWNKADEKMKINITVTCKIWSSADPLHRDDRDYDEYFTELVELCVNEATDA